MTDFVTHGLRDGTSPTVAPAEPGIDLAAYEEDVRRACPYCCEQLHPLIETQVGLYVVCTNTREHGWPKVFRIPSPVQVWERVPDDGLVEEFTLDLWVVAALIREREIPCRRPYV